MDGPLGRREVAVDLQRVRARDPEHELDALGLERAHDRLSPGHRHRRRRHGHHTPPVRSAASEIISWQALAASHAVMPLGSYGGETSTQSNARKSIPVSARR